MKTPHLFAGTLLATALIAAPVLAQAKPAPTTKTTTTTAKPAVTKTTTTTATHATKPVATKTTMATHTTSTGKKITYDCSKKGNATKTVCKK